MIGDTVDEENGERGAMKSLWRSGCALAFAGIMISVLYAQRPFRVYPSVEGYDTMPLPSDWQRSAVWPFARLIYPPGPLDGYYPRFQGNSRQGLSLWPHDHPQSPHPPPPPTPPPTRLPT